MIALSEAAVYMAEPWSVGFNAPEAVVGGALPEYNLYESSEGWVAVAALEPHFSKALFVALDCPGSDIEKLRSLFQSKTAKEWEAWAKEQDLPVVAVKSS